MSGELPSSLVLLGAGKMGQAMLTGWLARGLEPSRITAIDPHLDESGRAILAKARVRLIGTPDDVDVPEALVLAIKPQTLESAADGARRLIGRRTLVLSILAGKRIADLASRLGASAA
ncbi:MAG: NAD(P)-binding domain-containing protein, partial [Hyphomicrobiales bacterium]|nr:NAD(P)-binding domain-containing protein [Hyphomicrobiales bacterium]